MLKGKKKALAAQVLLGLMVAGNAYAADITIGEGTDSDSDTNYYAGNHYDRNPYYMAGDNANAIITDKDDISNKTIEISVGGQDYIIWDGNGELSNNTITFGSGSYDVDVYGKKNIVGTVQIAKDLTKSNGNVIVLKRIGVKDDGGAYLVAGDTDIVQLYKYSTDTTDQPDWNTVGNPYIPAAPGTALNLQAGSLEVKEDGIIVQNVKLADTLKEDNKETSSILCCTAKKQICVQDVTFNYDEGQSVLKNLNIRFEAGKKYAIVGGSGSGKTTLLNLLMRTYDNYEGSIQYDSIELKEISSESLFQVVSLVQQNVFVFNDTIYNNVTLYKEFQEKEVEAAMGQAGLAQLIHSHGKDYICGENGNALSGGEKQRISIARALLRKTSVLLMDEATAALDEITANEIMNTILSMKNMTGIIVTHRLDETILKQYDEIVVLHNGKVAECGTFEKLLEKKGVFHSLYSISR